MPKVGKVTVSLPLDLLAYVERKRAETGATRSETVAKLLSEARRAIDLREREAQYTAAYEVQAEAPEEKAFTAAASASLFAHAGDDWADVAPPPPVPTEPRGGPSRAGVMITPSEETGRVTVKGHKAARAITPAAVAGASKGKVPAKAHAAKGNPVRKAAKRVAG
jgi:hypothetical protein